jgi:hypothetical protein
MNNANFGLIEEVLDYLEQIHKSMKNKVSLQRQSKELAIYIITGRILTHCRATSYLLLNGFFAEAGILIRSIYESVFVAEYFYVLDPHDEVFVKWFDDKIIKPSEARKAQSRVFEKLDEFIKKMDSNYKVENNEMANKKTDELNTKLYKGFSKYTHPTFNISKINLNHYNLEFDYKCERIRKTSQQLPYSFNAVIVLVLNMFCTCFYMIDLDSNTFNKLRTYVSLLEG